MQIPPAANVLHISPLGLGSKLYTVVAIETKKWELLFWAASCGFYLQGLHYWHADKAEPESKTTVWKQTKARTQTERC